MIVNCAYLVAKSTCRASGADTTERTNLAGLGLASATSLDHLRDAS
jgi:hypothetical protein